MMNEKIFLLEDDEYLTDGLCELLESEGYSVTHAANLADARKILFINNFDLIILDVILPDGTSTSLCSELCERGITAPKMFLTACDDEIQIVRGLDSGADDYVTKPFKLLEFLSRVRALLRRNKSVYSCGGITLDVNAMSVKKDGKTVFLTPTEFQILALLIKNQGKIVTRSAILQNIWDSDGNYIDDNTLSVHMSRLREKINTDAIKTVRSVGYKWECANDNS